ncbi:uncharacterized protein [Diabrotica undecimpunctata]|uniref:uncharacterized protein n=1 Tax=Diabrotica undecimpunctata TaxID=50387 RepID=UPI003B632606
MLITWVNDNNNTKWSEGLRFIQSKKNRSFHRGIGRSPYKAMFGSRQTNGLDDADLSERFKNEEEINRVELCLENLENQDKYMNESLEILDNNYLIKNNEDAPNTQEGKIDGNFNDQLTQRTSKMICKSSKRFAPLKIGTNVFIRVPDVERGRLGRITTRNNGPLDRLFSRRNKLLHTDSQLMFESNDISSKKIPLQTAANMPSEGSGQGFLRCNCKRCCGDNKCSCKQRNKKCISKCHGSLTCKNK